MLPAAPGTAMGWGEEGDTEQPGLAPTLPGLLHLPLLQHSAGMQVKAPHHVPVLQVGKLRHRGAVSSITDLGIPFHQLQHHEYGSAQLTQPSP